MAGNEESIQLTSPSASHLNDDEIIMAQMQSTLNSSTQFSQPSNTPEQKKRKSLHKADVERYNRDKNARKKARAEKRALKAPESIQDVETFVIDTSLKDDSHSAEPMSRSQSVKPRAHPGVESIFKPPGFVRCPDKASALMQSILKDCTPERVNQRQFQNFMHPTIKSEEDAHSTTSAPKEGLNEKLSHNVSILSFPIGYVPGPEGTKKRFYCPVNGCNKKYSRRYSILEHLNVVHGDQQLIDNEDGTMKVVFANQAAHRAGSVTDLGATHSIMKTESREGADASFKELFSKPNTSTTITRPISASEVIATKEVVHKPVASLPGSGDEDNTATGEEQSLALIKPIDSESKNKKRRLADNSNGTQQDRTEDLYLHGAETVMDSWEIKPGLIRANRRLGGQGFEVEQDIAFSAARISLESNGISLPGMEFQLCRLSAGTNRIWVPNTSHERICSVASGKVHVSVGKKEFSIGAHGMWRIPLGLPSTATNLWYAEAVLHVCIMK